MFYQTFNTVPTNFLNAAESVGGEVKGVRITYEDNAGDIYSSTGGNQNGSSFTVINATQGDVNGVKTKTILGTVSCKVYKVGDASIFKTITNGSFKIVVRESLPN